MKIYPESIESKIGFDAVRSIVGGLCLSTLGQQKCREMVVSSDFEAVSRLLGQTDEMARIITAGEDLPLSAVHDVRSYLSGIRVAGTHIPEDELVRLRASLGTMAAIASFFAQRREEDGGSPYPALDRLASAFGEFPEAMRDIDRVIDKFGSVKDNASPALASIRSQLASMQGSIVSAMRRVIAQAVKAGILDADASPSLRDGRPVIPVPPMHKRKIPGIVHDESATGKTIFIEPAEVVEASNRLREMQMDERREVMRILVELADKLRPHVPEMLDSYDILADFDFIHAKARFALQADCAMPHLHRDMQLELYHACHPILKQTLEKIGKVVVPLDIRLTSEDRMLVISGPNAGGKSVTLKTVAIAQYMAQCGMLPPCQTNSHISIADGIFIDIGDDQSIENELSTYSSHLRNLKYFLANGTDRTLCLIDEFGSGTEPQIGGAIAQAVLAQFVQIGMWGVITTHFQNIKRFAEETPGLINGSMLYDRQLMQPLFALSIGNAGSSFALEIARKIGLPADIVNAAQDIVGSDYVNLDKYLLDIARDKRYWENKRLQIKQKEKKIDALIEKYDTEAEQLHSKRREIIDEARQQAKDIISASNAAVERTIHEIKTANAEREKTLQARKQLEEEKRRLETSKADQHPMLKKKRKNDKKEPKPQAEKRPVAVGDNVLLDGTGTVGKVLEINGANAVVAFGMLKTTVKASRLTITQRQIKSVSTKPVLTGQSIADTSRERQLNFSQEIDVRGMRVDEAVQATMYFIDDAIQFRAARVRILHGTGTGALRQYIREYLKTISSVASFHDEDVRFGGAGITVVDLA